MAAELSDTFLVLAVDLPDVGDSRGAALSAEKSALADMLLTAAESAGAYDITLAVLPGVAPWDALLADPRIWHFAFHATDTDR